ncbi:hypothetical protein NDU88_004875 [Pleurodeles waltl]|uniref:Uncharacterized protein n=1 Tax=Pleurodeles waltl TaxID=8319 RepID=A0AAV7W6G9_PLEWA|nr:hypothetical protein NDU88_004875 [Pleurodeles waltl]
MLPALRSPRDAPSLGVPGSPSDIVYRKVTTPLPQKSIMIMLSATPSSMDPMRQLENTLEKHTAMFDKVLQAIQDSKTVIEMLLGAIQIETVLFHTDQAKLAERVDGTESKFSANGPTVETLQKQVKFLQKELTVRA